MAAAVAAAAPFRSAKEQRLFEAAYYRGRERQAPATLAIPRFYKPAPTTPQLCALRDAAREAHVARRARATPDNPDLSLAWQLLSAHAAIPEPEDSDAGTSPPPTTTTTTANTSPTTPVPLLTYTQFCQCGEAAAQQLPEAFAVFFRPSVFFRLRRDAQQRVSANQLFDLMMRSVALTQIRLSFCLYDTEGDGRVTERDLQQFIIDHVTSMPRLAELQESFLSTYAVYAARKFMFFLDPGRTGKVGSENSAVWDILFILPLLFPKDPRHRHSRVRHHV